MMMIIDIPVEIKQIIADIFGKNIEIKVKKDKYINAYYECKNGFEQITITDGLIHAYRNGIISIKNIEAILWHEHGERQYYSRYPRKERLKCITSITAIITVALIIISYTKYIPLLLLLSFTFFVLVMSVAFVNCVIAPLNQLKEYLCDVHSAINMHSTLIVVETLLKLREHDEKVKLSKREMILEKIKQYTIEKIYDSHPSTEDRVKLLTELKNICNNS